MFLENSNNSLEALIAESANFCNKPFNHSVVNVNGQCNLDVDEIDITFNILCRDSDGSRLKIHDLELEIFKSNNKFVLVIAKLHYPDEPVLWSGNKDFWMDSKSGKKCVSPKYSYRLENLANRIRNFLD